MNRLSAIIIIQNPDHNPHNGSLNEQGNRQIRFLLENFKELDSPLLGKSALILTSTATCSIETASIVSKHFNIPVEENAAFRYDSSLREDVPAVLAVIREKEEAFDTLVIVTHPTYVTELADACQSLYFGNTTLFFDGVDNGEGYLLKKGETLVLK